MLYVATVHYRSPKWIEVQTSYLRENISVPTRCGRRWRGSTRRTPATSTGSSTSGAPTPGKLNHLASEIAHEASRDDLLMFLDGDAFPIADPMGLVDDALSRAPLVAVRRAENVDEPQPHPCFCVTSVGTWLDLPGDWTAGPVWPGAKGRPTTDVGGNLMRRLELTNTPWVQVLRSNRRNLDPLWFAVYGGVIYHHGAGFRMGELSPVDRAGAPEPLPLMGVPVVGKGVRLLNSRRWKAWEEGVERSHLELSNRVYERIRAGGTDWLADLT